MNHTNVDNWDEVDSALKRMGEIDIALEEIKGDATLQINKIKDEAKKSAAPLESERKHIEKVIKLFAENRKDEFSKKRSRELNFGTVGYRLVKSVSIPRDKEKVSALLKSLKSYGLSTCIKFEEKPDKDKISELADDTIVKLGLKRTVKDNFRINPRLEKIQSTEDENE